MPRGHSIAASHLDMTQTELAERLSVSFARVSEIMRGKIGVTPDTALRLERLFGMEAQSWRVSPGTVWPTILPLQLM